MSNSSALQNPTITLISRIFLSALFIPAGWGKLTNLAGTAQFFASIGLPMPSVTAIIVGLVEFLGGLAVLIGFKTRYASLLLAAFTIGAAFIAHFAPFDQTSFMKNVAIAGGFLALAQYGAGAYSVDGRGRK